MIRQYTFDIDTAELLGYTVWQTGVSGATPVIVRPHDRTRECVGVTIKEGDHAFREFKAYFGDDSSWPPGWWERLTGPYKTSVDPNEGPMEAIARLALSRHWLPM